MYTVRQSDSIPHVSDICPLVCRECSTCPHVLMHLPGQCPTQHHLQTYTSYRSCVYTDWLLCCASAQQCSQCCSQCSKRQCCCGDAWSLVWRQWCPCAWNRYGSSCRNTTCVSVGLSNITESEAILNTLSDSRGRTCEHHMATMKSLYTDISVIVESDPALSSVACEHLTRLKALLTALQSKPNLPALPSTSTSREPSNKRAATQQRYFSSTRKAKRPRQRLTLAKPTKEQQFLLRALDGTTELISSQPPVDHDYSTDVMCHTINFEHSYKAQ